MIDSSVIVQFVIVLLSFAITTGLIIALVANESVKNGRKKGIEIGIGAAFGFFVDWIHALISNSYLKGFYLSGFIISLLSVVILRVTIEVYSIIYKAAIEFRDYMKEKK